MKKIIEVFKEKPKREKLLQGLFSNRGYSLVSILLTFPRSRYK
jgi:hypothetical protein